MGHCIGEKEGEWGSALERGRGNGAVHWREGGEMGQCIAERKGGGMGEGGEMGQCIGDREGERGSALERGRGNGSVHWREGAVMGHCIRGREGE